MSAKNLSSQQMADYVSKNEGGSFDWHTGTPASGPGFMVAKEGAEYPIEGSLSASTIDEFKEEHGDLAAATKGAHLGVWGSENPTLDISMKVSNHNQAKSVGRKNRQEAAYALPGTSVAPNVTLPKGGDVLLNTSDLGKNDVDKEYRSTGKSLSKNEYQNPDWDEVGGTQEGKPVTYGDVLRTINRNRVNRQRGV
jgi:hypothetical protein